MFGVVSVPNIRQKAKRGQDLYPHQWITLLKEHDEIALEIDARDSVPLYLTEVGGILYITTMQSETRELEEMGYDIESIKSHIEYSRVTPVSALKIPFGSLFY